VDQWRRDGDRQRDAEGGVRDGKWNDVAVVEEEQAGEEAPKERDGREDGIGQVRGGEEHGGGERCDVRLRWDEDEEAAEEDVLQENLLDERPESIAPVARDEVRGVVQSVLVRGDEDEGGGEDECEDDNPEGACEVGELEAEGACALEGEYEDRGERDDGGDIADSLPGIRCPDDDEDECVGESEFQCGAAASHLKG
jgi:hypothetical protein